MDRCLLCDNAISNKANMYELVFIDDVICFKCRNLWIKNKKKYFIEGIKVDSSYLYEENFSRALLQYKECFDEALYKIFLFRYLNYFKVKYFNYSIIPMPSNKKSLEERGFNHLTKIFEDTNMNIVNCLYKKDNTKQLGLHYDQRLQISESIGIIDMRLPSKVVLVDDVCTTGSTLKAAIKLIKPKVKKLKVYTISTNHKNVM